MVSKSRPTKMIAPESWISIEEFEVRNNLRSGRVTTENREKPRAWLNPDTDRVIYRVSPISKSLNLGELQRSNYTIKQKSMVNFSVDTASETILEKALTYMHEDDGATPIDKFFN